MKKLLFATVAFAFVGVLFATNTDPAVIEDGVEMPPGDHPIIVIDATQIQTGDTVEVVQMVISKHQVYLTNLEMDIVDLFENPIYSYQGDSAQCNQSIYFEAFDDALMFRRPRDGIRC